MSLLCGPLWEEQNAGNNKDEKNSRRRVAAQRQPPSIKRLVQKISDDSAQRARENERSPK